MSKIFKIENSFDLPVDRLVRHDGKEFIPFGKDNLFPQKVAKLSRESAAHRSIINSKVLYIGGEYLESEDKKTIDFVDAIGLHKTYKNILLDYLMGGNGWIEIVKDRKGNLLNIFHQDFTKVRIGKGGDYAILHGDWAKYSNEKSLARNIALYPDFSKGDDGFNHSLIQVKDYEPEFTFYGVPNWIAGLTAASIGKKTNEYNDERLTNKFSIDGMLVVPGIDDVPTAEKFEKKLTEYQGSENAGKIMAHYLAPLQVGEQREKAEFIAFNQSADGLFMNLHKQSEADLIKVHNWYRSLSAFEENTGFDTQRINNDYKIALSNVIYPMQEVFLSIFNEVLNMGELTIHNDNPVYVPADVEFIWEVRKRLGLDYNENDPKQQEFYSTIKK